MSNIHEEEVLGKGYDARLTRRLIHYLGPYKWSVVLALSMAVAITPLEAVGPYLFAITVDRYLTPALAGRLPYAAGLRGLGWIALIYVFAMVGSFILQYVQMRVMQRVGQQTMYDLRKEIFDHLQRLPMSFFDRTPVGRLVTRVTTDVDALNDLFAAGVVAMLNDFILIVVFVAILFWMDWKLALVTLSVLPFIFLSTALFRTKVRDANRRIRTAIARINSFLQEQISGMSVVQLFNHEKRSESQFEKLNRVHMDAYKDAIQAFALFYPGVEFLSTVAVALIFWYGGLRVLVGGLTVGMIIAFMQYSQRFFRPIQDLSDKFNILQTAMASSERIFKLLDEPLQTETLAAPEAAPGGGPRALQAGGWQPRGEIEFRNVWFSYRAGANGADEDWVLRDVSFRVAPGPDRCHRRSYRRRQDHAGPAPATLLRNPARGNPVGWRGYPLARFA